VKIDGIAYARKHRRNHVGLAFHSETHVAHKAFIKDFVNRFTVVGTAVRFAHYTRALRRGDGFGHDAPHRETRRKAGRFRGCSFDLIAGASPA
jgi:hypothetical protein